MPDSSRVYRFSDFVDSVNLPSSKPSVLVVVFGMWFADRGVLDPSFQNSTSPSVLKEPRFTSCPFSRIKSSIVTGLSENIYGMLVDAFSI
jgi:hypothetical protein